jgi:hypothetical protein
LSGKSRKNLARRSKISSASREEETGTKTSLLIVLAGDCEGYGGFSGAGHSVQPKDGPFAPSVSPLSYSREDVDSGSKEATGRMLFARGIECCLGGTRQVLEQISVVTSGPAAQTIDVRKSLSA